MESGDALPRTHRAAPWIAAGVAVAVTALVAGGLALDGRGPLAGLAPGDPSVLHIGTGFTGATTGAVMDGGNLRAGRYVLTGSLPGSPDSGTAFWLRRGSVDAAQVTALAAALGLVGEPTRAGGDWVVRDGVAVLRVYDAPGLPFAYDADPSDDRCPSIPVDGYGGPDTAVGCVVTSPSPSTTPPPGPDEATLDALGRSLAAALGAQTDVSTWTGSPDGGVVLSPSVDGVATSGVETALQVSNEGVRTASGWLGPLVGSGVDPGDTYPLRSATAVFGDLSAMPEPMIACPEDLVNPSPLCGGDVLVTGAAYGLTLAYDDGRPVLVPAWLFDIKGADAPLAQVAVAQRYLADPTDTGSPGSGGGSTPGSTGTVTPPEPGTEPEPVPSDLPTEPSPL